MRLGKSYFKLTRGLPQGLSLSSVMNSFYYSKLEERAVHPGLEATRAKGELILVMRLTDDYLVLSDS